MSFFQKEIPFGRTRISLASLLWFFLSILAVLIQLNKHSFNNYLIFKGVFWHTVHQTNLYSLYPTEYTDCNHYGVLFSLIIAPFAMLPDYLGCFLWGIANTYILYLAIQKLPLDTSKKNVVLWIALVEMMTTMHNVQFNPMLTSCILFSWIFVHQKKEGWATLFIVLGMLTKIYGVVGLAFFLFAENKRTFILSFMGWILLLFALPMLISSPAFVIQSYQDWFVSLTEKNSLNEESIMQGMSIMRLIKRGLHLPALPDLFFYGIGAVAAASVLIKYRVWRLASLQLQYLAFLLISVVIFSSSAESATYVIAMVGVGIWFVGENMQNKWIKALLILAIVLTSLSTTDLFPPALKAHFIRPYAIKALPCVLIWGKLILQILSTSAPSTKLARA